MAAVLVAVVTLGLWLSRGYAVAASPNAALLNAKRDAEAKGYGFFTARDEILTKAKQEGKLKILSGLDSRKPMREAFVKKYPFLDVQIEEITGTDAGQRFILELRAGQVKGWDVVHVSSENYLEYPEYTKKFDILGMSQHGVLAIPNAMVDPKFRNIVGMKKDPTAHLQYKVVDPVPVRLSETEAILNTAAHLHAALLWLEFVAGPEGQRIIDEHEPLKSSLFAQGSAVEKLIRGRKLSVLGWDDYADSPELVEKVVAAFGFPKAEK